MLFVPRYSHLSVPYSYFLSNLSNFLVEELPVLPTRVGFSLCRHTSVCVSFNLQHGGSVDVNELSERLCYKYS